MGPKNLNRRAQNLRYAAYGCLALIHLSLGVNTASWLPFVFGGLYCLVFPVLVSLAQSWVDQRSKWILGPLFIENMLTAGVLGYLCLPRICMLAALSVLLSGNVAQGGWRALTWAILTIPVGCLWGLYLSPYAQSNGATHWLIWLISALMLLGFTTVISALGYQQSMRLYQERERLDSKSRELAVMNMKLARYLAPQVYTRLFLHAGEKIPLTRKWLTIAFIDLAGFTLLTNRISPEEMTQVLNDFMTSMAALASEHQGTVDKFVGDGLLVFFGDARQANRQQEALRAIAMGKAAIKRMAELSCVWVSLGVTQAIGVRIGIASGFCTIGDFGQGDRLDYTVLGAPVNLASRLQQFADQDHMVISAATRSLVGGSLQLKRISGVELKEFPEQAAFVTV